MNIYDISQRAGVSIATVSRVLNNSPHVSAATRARVLAVMRESGYVPNAFARGLGLNTMRTIGLLCPDASDPFLATALSHLERDFREQGYDSILICTARRLADRMQGIAQLRQRHVDGMVLMGSSFVEENDEDNACIREAAAQVPVVILNGLCRGEHVYCVLCEDRKITARAVSALIAGGRRDILYLGVGHGQAARSKLAGYRQALAEHGTPEDPERIHLFSHHRPDLDEVIALLQQKWDAGIRFDAVMCAEDLLGIAAVKFARRSGLRVPEDLAVVGYNNSMFSRLCEPELTSIDNALPDVCASIVRTMMAALDGQETPQTVFFPGEIVIRQSTGTLFTP